MSETITRTRDEVNPDYMFQTINAELLVSAMQGKIDLNALAWRELRGRGLDEYGNWIGFDKPEEGVYYNKNMHRFVAIPRLDKFVYNTKDGSYPKAFAGLS